MIVLVQGSPRKRCWLLLATIVTTLTLAPTPAAAERLHLSYTVYFGYLPALDVAAEMRSGAGRYEVDASVAPQAWIAWALPWTARSWSAGRRLDDGTLRPERHLATATWGVRTRRTNLDFAEDGPVRATLEPPGLEAGRDPVPEEMLTGVLDPVSAVMALVETAGAGQGCAPLVPVFDGRRRFDMRAERLENAVMAGSSYSAYAGPVVVCRVRFTSLAGGYRDGERAKFWQSPTPGTERPPIDLWLAPLREGGPAVPVFVTSASVLGWVTVYLSSFRFDPD